MSPDEFDEVYFRLSKALGAASDPILFRDRLILISLQQTTVTTALRVIERASELPPDEELRTPNPSGIVINHLEHTPGAESRSKSSP